MGGLQTQRILSHTPLILNVHYEDPNSKFILITNLLFHKLQNLVPYLY